MLTMSNIFVNIDTKGKNYFIFFPFLWFLIRLHCLQLTHCYMLFLYINQCYLSAFRTIQRKIFQLRILPHFQPCFTPTDRTKNPFCIFHNSHLCISANSLSLFASLSYPYAIIIIMKTKFFLYFHHLFLAKFVII